MKTEFYAGKGMYRELIKTLEGIIIPYVPQDESIEIDEFIYRVRSYSLLINGDEVKAIIRLD